MVWQMQGHLRLRGALNVGDRLLTRVQRCGERAEQEHGERVEDGSELHGEDGRMGLIEKG